jgi:iron complex transport system substrate-binding protein
MAASGDEGQGNLVLEVFGNANMDNVVDESDVAYLQGVINGTNAATNLSDANSDDKINEDDIDWIEQIIQNTEKRLTIIDDSGRTVTISRPIQRIVSLNYRFPEALVAIGAKSKIVGVEERFKTRMKDIAEACEMMDVPVIGTSDDPDYEKILEIKPDVVIASSSMANEVAKKIPGIPVIGISSFISLMDSDHIYYDLRLLGMVAGETDGSTKLINFMKGYEDLIEERTNDLNPDKIPSFYLEGPMNYSIYVPSGSPGKILAEGCGGRNIASEVDIGNSSTEVSPEWVLDKNPDIIIKRDDYLGLDATEDDAKRALDELIASRTGWDKISAVKNHRIYLLEGDLMWTPRYLAGRSYLAKWFQPDLFSDLDPEVILRRYHEEFLGSEYRGTWAYPSK